MKIHDIIHMKYCGNKYHGLHQMWQLFTLENGLIRHSRISRDRRTDGRTDTHLKRHTILPSKLICPSYPFLPTQVVFSTSPTIVTSIPQTTLVSTPDSIQPNVPSTGSGPSTDPTSSVTATASLIFAPASTSDLSAATETYCTQFKEVKWSSYPNHYFDSCVNLYCTVVRDAFCFREARCTTLLRGPRHNATQVFVYFFSIWWFILLVSGIII